MIKHGVAGILVGKPSDVVVLKAEDGTTEDLIIKQRWVYVKKCLREEQKDGIILCDKSRSNLNVGLVLAVSKDCGKFHKLTKEQRRRGEMAQVEAIIKPTDKVLLQDESEWGYKLSPYGVDEWFIREDLIEGVIEGD